MTDPIDELLAETHLAGDARLLEFLTDLEKTATSVRPIPSAELAALLTPPPGRSTFRPPGTLITTLIIAGALGAGVSAAAANPEIREETGKFLGVIFGTTVPEPRADPIPEVTSPPGSGRSMHDPTPLDATTWSHPTRTDHPDGSDHPGPADPPGLASNPSEEKSNGHSRSDPPPAGGMPDVPAERPEGPGGATGKPE